MRSTGVLAAAAAAFSPLAFAAVSFHPPGGTGKIAVTLDGSTTPSGCLNAAGKWTATTSTCATFGANGVGAIGGPSGNCDLTATSDIFCTSASQQTAWLGVFFDGNSSAMYLEANVGATDSQPGGGLLWYATTIARTSSIGEQTATLNGRNTTDPVRVYLSWIATS